MLRTESRRVRGGHQLRKQRWPMARLTLCRPAVHCQPSVYDIAGRGGDVGGTKKPLGVWRTRCWVNCVGPVPVRGVLPAVLAAKRDGWPAVVVPNRTTLGRWTESTSEIRTLGRCRAGYAGGLRRIATADTTPRSRRTSRVVGQSSTVRRRGGRRGAHHLMLTGPTELSAKQCWLASSGAVAVAVERESLGGVTAIHSVAGLWGHTLLAYHWRRTTVPALRLSAGVGGWLARAVAGRIAGCSWTSSRDQLFSALEALRTPLEETVKSA